MATGTSGNLFGSPDGNAQSLFKHELLSHYLPTFISMTGSTAPGKRVVVLDGFAGRGRYKDGQPASAERILQAMSSQNKIRDIEAFFAEKSNSDFTVLASVVEEYRRQGVNGVALPGTVEKHLDHIVGRARGVPLFLFLDPCGAGMDFERLVGVLTGPRLGKRPVTEVLLNFSADMSRRVSGALISQASTEQRAMDAACGGQWWRRVARETLEKAPQDRSGKPSFEPLTHAIAAQYASLLARAAGMFPVTVPVYRQLGHQPVYHLVFFTRSPYGLWVFADADAAARARQAWLRHLGKLADERGGPALISDLEFKEELIRQEQSDALSIVTGNVRDLLKQRPGFRLVDQARELFGTAYGVATENVVGQAVTDLYSAGELHIRQRNSPVGTRVRIRELVVTRPRLPN